MEHNKIAERRNVKSVIVSLVMVVIGIVMAFAISKGIEDKTAAMYLMTMSIALTVAIIGLANMIWGSKERIYDNTKSRIKEYSLYFTSLEHIADAIERENVDVMKKFIGDSNSGVRLDVAISSDTEFAVCQLYRYVPYSFEAASDVYEISEVNRGRFCNLVKEINTNQNK